MTAEDKQGITDNDDVIGYYIMEKPSNEWHYGKITTDGANLKWVNRANKSWTLIPDLQNNLLKTDQTNPYQDLDQNTKQNFNLVVENGIVQGFKFGSEFYKKFVFDYSSMIPLTFKEFGFYIDLVGPSIKGSPYNIFFDTGSWETSVPLSLLDVSKIKYLEKDAEDKPIETTDCWGKKCYKVSGQLGAFSADGKTEYLKDDFVFFARLNADDDSIICGAFPSLDKDSNLPSLPYALALKYSKEKNVGLGIVSNAPNKPISEGWTSIKSYLQLGSDPSITNLLQWRTDVPNYPKNPEIPFCPEAVSGFKVEIEFPDVIGGLKLTSPDMVATVDTGSSNLRMRLGENNPQNQSPYNDYFKPNKWYPDGKSISGNAIIKILFTDSSGTVSSYEYPATDNFELKLPTMALFGDWDGNIPWESNDNDKPKNRMDLGNTIYYFCPVYFWDIDNKRVGILFK